jgi:signal transduction histidine kinase
MRMFNCKHIGAFVIASAFCAATPAMAAATAESTKAFVEKAVAHVKSVGKEKAFADFSKTDGPFIDGELYMFCFAPDGMTLAHGGNPALLGKNLITVKDPDGLASTAALIKTGMEQGAGWVDFKWPNPASKKVEQKSSYVVKVDDKTVCGSGYYKG